MPTGERVDPYLDFQYVVEMISPGEKTREPVGGFSEVSGIEVEIETEEYEEGGVNHRPHVLPTRGSHGTLTLQRGLTDEAILWGWVMAATRGQAERKPVRVIMADREGEETIGWEFGGTLPVRWSGPDLAAQDGQVAMEELELAYERINRYGGPR